MKEHRSWQVLISRNAPPWRAPPARSAAHGCCGERVCRCRLSSRTSKPVPIRPYLEGHTVSAGFQRGSDKLKNGELLVAAEQAGFELFLTTDKNIRYRQNLADRKIAIVVLGQQQWPHVQPHIQRVVDAVNAATPGSFAEIDIPYPD